MSHLGSGCSAARVADESSSVAAGVRCVGSLIIAGRHRVAVDVDLVLSSSLVAFFEDDGVEREQPERAVLSPTWDTVRLFVHVLGATVWVGGQLTLAGLVPRARALGPAVPSTLARRFARLS